MKVFFLLGTALGFFQFFEDHHEQQEQQQQKLKKEEISCLGWECQGSNVCVDEPIDCPCLEGETKCQLKDWYICISGHQNCDSLKK